VRLPGAGGAELRPRGRQRRLQDGGGAGAARAEARSDVRPGHAHAEEGDAMSQPDFLSEPRRAWEPYRPRAAELWALPRVAHLHRRAGLGATWQQLQRDMKDGPEAALQRVLQGDTHGPDGRPAEEYEETAAVLEASARRRPTLERIT